MSDSSTAVARRDSVVSLGTRAREVFDDKQRELIRQTVAKDCNTAEFHMFLELCARYELDPFAKEIYAAKMGNKNGETGNVVIIVGRDGLLKIAQRSGEFEGIVGDVVRENDVFVKKAESELPEHTITGHVLPKGENGAYPEGSRGGIVGAWAAAYRKGRKHPTYFYAPLHEYLPTNPRKLEYSPWSSQASAMILKCAESMALRKAFSINGVVAEEEMSRALERDAQDMAMTEWGEEPTIAAWLPMLFEAANAVREDTYRPAKMRLLLRGKTDEEREQLADDIVAWLREHNGAVPARPTEESLRDGYITVTEEETEIVHPGGEQQEDPEVSLFPEPGDPTVNRGDTSDETEAEGEPDA